MYDFYLSWHSWTHRSSKQEATDLRRELARAHRETSRWTAESSYRFREGVAEGFLQFATAGFLVLLGVLLAFQPTGTAEAVALFGIRAWSAFFASGSVLVAVPYFRAWFRRRAGEALPARTRGWWMLLVQVPVVAAFAFVTG